MTDRDHGDRTDDQTGSPVLHIARMRPQSPMKRLDLLYRTRAGAMQPRIMPSMPSSSSSRACRIRSVIGTVIALFFLALLVKLITAPLTTMAFRGMRDMQRIQPLLKELQEKYKEDQAEAGGRADAHHARA